MSKKYEAKNWDEEIIMSLEDLVIASVSLNWNEIILAIMKS